MAFIEYLLDKFEDPNAFELLCSELMLKEGYAHLNPVGGTGDQGRDAETTIYEAREGERTIAFQFSLEKTTRQKVLKTIRRLAESKRTLHKMIFVFSSRVPSKQRASLTDLALSDHGLVIEIYDQTFLAARLGLAAYQDVVERFFAAEIAQLRSDFEQSRLFASGAAATQAEERCLINLMSYARHPLSPDVRQGVIREALRAVLCADLGGASTALLSERVRAFLPPGFSVGSSVDSALASMRSSGEVVLNAGRYILDVAARKTVERNLADVIAGRRALLARVHTECRLPPDCPDRFDVNRATDDFLCRLFRKHGTEVANAILNDAAALSTCLEADSVDVLLSEVVGAWLPDLGSRFRAAMKAVLRMPAGPELEYLSALSSSYVCMQVLNVDPEGVNIQRGRSRDSVAVLDTDVVLSGIVTGADRERVSQALVRLCRRAGIQCFAFQHTVEEIVNRIERSVSLFDDLGDPTHIPMDKKDLIQDIFLDIYFDKLASGDVQCFPEFISEYYGWTAPAEHVRALIEDRLGAPIERPDTFVLLEQKDKLDRIKQTIEESRTRALAYKNEKMYEADALAMLIIEQQNRDMIARGRLGRWYLVSNDRHMLHAYLTLKGSFRIKPSILPVHFVELLRQTPDVPMDSDSFGAILASEAMLRGAGRNYAPIIAAMTKVGVEALAMPRQRLIEVVDEIERADLARWLVKLRARPTVDERIREEIREALARVINESASRSYELEHLKELARATTEG